MSGELARYFNTEVRQHSRELARIDQREDMALAQTRAIGNVVRHGVVEAMQTEMVVTQAIQMAPGGTPVYNMLAVSAGVEIAGVIARLNRSGR